MKNEEMVKLFEKAFLSEFEGWCESYMDSSLNYQVDGDLPLAAMLDTFLSLLEEWKKAQQETQQKAFQAMQNHLEESFRETLGKAPEDYTIIRYKVRSIDDDGI